MLQYEAKIAEYVKSTGNHVLLRATPIYTGDDLVATGVNLEAFSVEDIGSGIRFNVFLYNIQPGIVINYADGTSMPDPKNMPVATPTPEPLLTLEPTATDEPTIQATSTRISATDTRRGRDLNPRRVAPRALSRRLQSAALPPRQGAHRTGVPIGQDDTGLGSVGTKST